MFPSPDSTLTSFTSGRGSVTIPDSEADAEQASPEYPIIRAPERYDSVLAPDFEVDAEQATPESMAGKGPVEPSGRESPIATDSEADAEQATPESLDTSHCQS